MQPHHLYVHVPFCRLVCAYCDFVTVGGRRSEIPRYVDALAAELAMRPTMGQLRTMYFGGGTPSLLTAEQVARLIRAATEHWINAALGEVTIEANPSVREVPDWGGLLDAGVTRLSLGLQSLRDTQLRALARGHTAAEGRAAYAGARRAGFANVSIDLIYGIPDQSIDDWHAGLAAAVALEPEHISVYALQLVLAPDEWAAPPRPGALRWRRRMAERQDDGLAAAQYELAEELLERAGYHHYELSSWARPGFESVHNSAYWQRRAYTGIGVGAHSYDGVATRSWNARGLDAYVERVEAGERPVAGAEELDAETRAFEAVALGLRFVSGLGRRSFATEFGTAAARGLADGVAEGEARGLLESEGDTVRLTRDGRLLASEALLPFLPTSGG
jgi:oxygen-independent coproporphyrinogen-3 oxidase